MPPEEPATLGRPVTPASQPSGASAFLDETPRQLEREPHTIMPRSPILDDIEHHEPKDSKGSQSKTTYSEPREWRIPPIARYLRPVLASLLVIGLLVGIVAGIGALVSYFLNRSENTATTPSPIAPTYTLATSVEHPERGTISTEPNDTSYKSGTVVQLTAVPASGYGFDKWSGDVADSSPTIPITIDSNKNVIAHFKLIDTTPPAITVIQASPPTDTTVTINWATDEPTTGQIEYGTTDSYGKTQGSSKLTPSLAHSVHLTGLTSYSRYHFRVNATDESGNQIKSQNRTFTTISEIRTGHKEGERAPDFGPFPLWGNEQTKLSLSQYQGKKVLLDFWSTRCGGCLAGFPTIRSIYQHEKCNRNAPDSEWAVLTICVDGENRDRIERLIAKYSGEDQFGPFEFPMLLDEGFTTKKPYNVWQIPKLVFIDTEGVIRKVVIGNFDNVQTKDIEAVKNILDSM
jgi:thiol-disulfide isomerase/thioredoxin